MPRYKGKIRLRDGNLEIEAEVEVDTSIDPKYGADADGNRGEGREFVEDVSVIGIEVVGGEGFEELETRIMDKAVEDLDKLEVEGGERDGDAERDRELDREMEENPNGNWN